MAKSIQPDDMHMDPREDRLNWRRALCELNWRPQKMFGEEFECLELSGRWICRLYGPGLQEEADGFLYAQGSNPIMAMSDILVRKMLSPDWWDSDDRERRPVLPIELKLAEALGNQYEVWAGRALVAGLYLLLWHSSQYGDFSVIQEEFPDLFPNTSGEKNCQDPTATG